MSKPETEYVAQFLKRGGGPNKHDISGFYIVEELNYGNECPDTIELVAQARLRGHDAVRVRAVGVRLYRDPFIPRGWWRTITRYLPRRRRQVVRIEHAPSDFGQQRLNDLKEKTGD